MAEMQMAQFEEMVFEREMILGTMRQSLKLN